MSVQTTSSPFNAPLPAPLRMTFPEYLDWLDEDKHAEWVAGEVIMHSPVSRQHSQVGGFLLKLMLVFNEDNELGEVEYDPFQMKTAPHLPSRAPDILFVAKEHFDRLKPNLLIGAADLVVEIVSPESRGRDRGDKFYEYEEGGVREYWIIDPGRQQAEFYLLGANGRYAPAPVDASGRYHSAVLAGLFLDIEWLWRESPPKLREVLNAWEAGASA